MNWCFEQNKTSSSVRREKTVLQRYDKATYDVWKYYMEYMLIREP